MENKVINQKEYLKKYISLGDGDEKKKKMKKKHKMGMKTLKIIDDDIDLKKMRPIKEDEFDILLNEEDAPQIAGIIDERGPVDFTDKKRWKIMTKDEGGDLTTVLINHANKDKINLHKTDIRENSDLDLSPSRSKHSKNKQKVRDLSPYGRSKTNDNLKSSRSKHSKNKHMNSNPYERSQDDSSDLSPPRQSRNDDSDLSPSRQTRNYDSDLSPPRKNTKHQTSIHGKSRRRYRSSSNKNSDSDFSPPRKRKQDRDIDLYESRKKKIDKDSDLSTSRRKEYRLHRDYSPHSSSCKGDKGHNYHDENSPRFSKQNTHTSRSSRDKREKEYENRDRKSRSCFDAREKRKSRWDEDESERGNVEKHTKDHDDRATKTLDGKRAGFQAAKELREEIEAHKQRVAEHFSKLNNEIIGKGQATIVRKNGRRRNFEAEAEEKREQEAKQREIDEKYAKWGKGLKQVEDREEKLKNDLYEMSKPLARYADDADLDKELREQEREGDPMLEYIKQKQTKEGKRKADPPQYRGSYSPNRFGIKPGHRWDGVDRSNGYEKKWFETQNAKVALQEDAYKWSTADM